MNYKQIPFNIEIAKNIVAGKIEGKIITRNNHNVHIYEFDLKGEYIIAGKVTGMPYDQIAKWSNKGEYIIDARTDSDLFLLVKEEYKFKPFDKILISSTQGNLRKWKCSFFSHYTDDKRFLFTTEGGVKTPDEVLPFEGNEHLVGKPCIKNIYDLYLINY